MSSIDTNVLVRVVVRDDPAQFALAKAKVANGVFVSHTVLMESAWVLRSVYKWSRQQIADTLQDFIELDEVSTPHPTALAWALERYRLGGDWEDMLHLIASRGHGRFATFDGGLLGEAGEATPTEVEILA